MSQESSILDHASKMRDMSLSMGDVDSAEYVPPVSCEDKVYTISDFPRAVTHTFGKI